MTRTFEEFIRERWRERLATHRVLSVFDPTGRYAEAVSLLADPHTKVLSVGADIISAREDALEALCRLTEDPANATAFVLYQRRPRPMDEAGWLDDPLAPVALAGAIFPDGPADDFKSLCQQFLPDRIAEIDEVFASGEPAFGVINLLTEGAAAYPTLSELLQADGAKDILRRFLCPTPEQRKRLGRSKAWTKELGSLATRTLGFALPVKGLAVEEIRLALWRFILFSEFAADLPVTLPPALANVPRAAPQHAAFVYGLCEALRDSKEAEQAYEDAANQVAEQLQLPAHCARLDDLGVRDTFAFEERTFLRRFGRLLLEGPVDEAAVVAEARRRSFWIRDASRAAEWKLAGCCLEALRRLEATAPLVAGGRDRTAAEWIQIYVEYAVPVDTAYRQVEEVVAELVALEPPLVAVVSKVRTAYREQVDRLTRGFQQAVVREGWPVSGVLRATEVFERRVQQPWQTGKRVAFFWVDALRYDLGLGLRELIGTRHGVSVEPVCAQIPTFTRVGMAALLPGADTGLRLLKQRDGAAVAVHGEILATPDQRFQLVQRLIGIDRCRLVDLDDLVAARPLSGLEGVEVLVIKTTDIDSLGEKNPGYVVRLIPEIVRKLQLALNRLAEAGFDRAVVTGDHGFLWFAEAGAGDAVARPPGEWIEVKDRCVLGSGQSSSDMVLLETPHLGIRGDVVHYGTPRGVATFTAGARYAHQGLSLQECVLPLVGIDLRAPAATRPPGRVELRLTYRGESSAKVHILQPSLEVAYFGGDLFGPPEVRFRLEAFDAKGQRVGQAAASPWVNLETREATVQRGQAVKVPLRIEEGAAGRLQVRAANGETGEVYATMTLETDFHH